MKDFIKVLEELRARREDLDRAIDAIERLVDAGGRPTLGGNGIARTYTGMTISEAAKKYLKMINRPASTREIVVALEKGGINHKAKDFYASVYAILRQRARRPGDVVQVATDWALKEQEG